MGTNREHRSHERTPATKSTRTARESIIGRVQAYSAGYDRDFLFPRLAIAPGAQFTVYTTPQALKAQYGGHPVGAAVFLRVRPIGKQR